MKSLLFKCKENDAVLKLLECDNEIDEVWVKIQGEKSWTVIGYKDLIEAIKKAKDKFR